MYTYINDNETIKMQSNVSNICSSVADKSTNKLNVSNEAST